MADLRCSTAVLAALKSLQDKIRSLERERIKSIQAVKTLGGELVRRQEELNYSRQLHELTSQERSAADRLSYERLLAEKKRLDARLSEAEEEKEILKRSRGCARDRVQSAHTSQLALEAKVSVLERRVEEGERKARQKSDRYVKARKSIRCDAAEANAELKSLETNVQALQRNLRKQSVRRKAMERKRRHAQAIGARVHRYLDSVLKVNQELVMRVAQARQPPHSPSQRRTTTKKRTATASRPRTASSAHVEEWPGRQDSRTVDTFSIKAAVADALGASQAGNDPLPLLQGLYERIGFSVLQGENDNAVSSSLPTSSSRAIVANSHQISQHEESLDESKYVRGTRSSRFFPLDQASTTEPAGDVAVTEDVTSTEPGATDSANRDKAGNERRWARRGYSFAHSPDMKPTSIAERSPKTLRRLEDLASQLEDERAEVERWYKDVVHRATPRAFEDHAEAQLDSKSLTRAIACLQEKAQQLEVVRESLQILQACPQAPPAVLSPSRTRQKAAALNILDGLRQDTGER